VWKLVAIAVVIASAADLRANPVEATSLLGEPLARPQLPAERRAKLDADLAKAKTEYDTQPDGEGATIWYGRRLAYLGRYREAIDVFTQGLNKHPRSFKLLRHRGHRYITLRELDKAIADLTRAAELTRDVPDEIEPDGAPNAKNIPRSTNLSNIWYHLALAHYLKGDFAKSSDCWRRCMEYSRVNDDMLVATSYWLYLSLRREGRDAEATDVLAPIHAKMDILENDTYHRLLLMFKGELTEAQLTERSDEDPINDATIGYGLGAWKLLKGRESDARAAFEQVLKDPNWAPFGHIAAEAELARSRRSR
jgi:tetratricopeptide (TPR) repeat protein